MAIRKNNQTIVFAGGGHAHLYSLRRTRELTEQGFDVVLVNPSRFLYYSGMAPGLLSRVYRPEQDRIDVKYLVEKGGGRFVRDRIQEIRSDERKILLESGAFIDYDVMSVCLGSSVPSESIPASGERLVPVKPVENVEKLHWELRGTDKAEPHVLVIGGGAAGCETAANLSRLFEEHEISGHITLVDANSALLKSSPPRARREIERFLRSRGVEILLDKRVSKIEEGTAHLGDGERVAFDTAILSVGIEPHDVFRRSGLATDEHGGLFVDEHLRSISDGCLFGGGDAVAFRGKALPRLGVFATRQAPVIFHNLQAVLKGEPLRRFEPQSNYLYVLNLGNREGLAIYGPFVWRGRWAWRLKEHIDLKFMREHQYPEDKPGEVKAYFDRLSDEEAEDIGAGVRSLDERARGRIRVTRQYQPDGYARPELLAETDWLEKNLDDPGLKIIDCRNEPQGYQEGHVPRAVHLSYGDLGGGVQDVSPEEVARVFGELGIGDGDEVVIYDDNGVGAGSVWWTLFYYGHAKVRILNGGWKKWTAEKRPVTREIPRPKPSTFVSRPRRDLRVSAGEVREKALKPDALVFESRDESGYPGILKTLGYTKRNRQEVPSARRVDWRHSLLRRDNTLKSASDFAALFRKEGLSPSNEAIVYYPSGRRPGYELFALRLMGYDNVKTSEVCCKEQSNGEDRVEKGPARAETL